MPSQLKALMILNGLGAILFLSIHAMCILGFGWRIAGVELFVLLPIVSLIASAYGLAMFLSPRESRIPGAKIAAGAALMGVLWFPIIRGAFELRRYGFEQATVRAETLIVAIERYVREHGSAPESIDLLVPEYLPAIPDRLPPIGIISGKDVRDDFGGNHWVLHASVATGFINFDSFMYFPNGDYPDEGYGGWIERIRGWAYVHE